MDIKTLNNIQFGARVVFPAKKDGVKPFVVVKNFQTTKRQSFNFNKQTISPTKLFQKLCRLAWKLFKSWNLLNYCHRIFGGIFITRKICYLLIILKMIFLKKFFNKFLLFF